MGKFKGSILEPQSGDSVTWYQSAKNPSHRKCPNLRLLPCFARMLNWEFFPECSKAEVGQEQGQVSFAGGEDSFFPIPIPFSQIQHWDGMAGLGWAGLGMQGAGKPAGAHNLIWSSFALCRLFCSLGHKTLKQYVWWQGASCAG